MAWRKWFVRLLVFTMVGGCVGAWILYQRFTNPTAVREQLAAKLAGAEKTIASTRTAAMSNVRGIAADAAGTIVQRLTGVVPDAASVNAAVDASLKG